MLPAAGCWLLAAGCWLLEVISLLAARTAYVHVEPLPSRRGDGGQQRFRVSYC